MTPWEYLEVCVDLRKKTWTDSAGRKSKLRKGSTAPLLADLGHQGWDLAGTVPLDRANGAYRLYFKRAVVAVVDIPADVSPAAPAAAKPGAKRAPAVAEALADAPDGAPGAKRSATPA
jgi:hypothetical protein